MPYVSAKPILQQARKGGYAVGAFNFSTLGIFRAIAAAAESLRAPVLIETSGGEARHLGMENAVALVSAFAEKSKIPIALHLDHGKSFKDVKAAIDAGYSSVHMDGSELEFDKNVKLTKKIVELAHSKDVSVEGELGHVFGGSVPHAEAIESVATSELYTDPEQARELAEKTGIDSLAVAIGSAHGIWKSSPKLDLPRLGRIAKLTKLPIVLHGGSGIPNEQVRKAISLGVAKINVNTELRIAYTNELRSALLFDVEQVVPYKYLSGTIPAVQSVVEEKMRVFGVAGKA